VSDYENLDGDQLFAVSTLTMVIGINEITEDNIDEFLGRVHTSEALFGAYFSGTDEETGERIHGTPRKLIERFIGLHTNASPLTAAQYGRELIKRARREYHW
jgi:hypothetical protein